LTLQVCGIALCILYFADAVSPSSAGYQNVKYHFLVTSSDGAERGQRICDDF